MYEFRFNIVKINYGVIYQLIPVNIETRKRLYELPMLLNSNKGRLIVHFFSEPKLNDYTVTLGLEKSSGQIVSKIFKTNEERDIYYDKLVTSVEKAIKELKTLL